eukprot:6145761-Pyramimonas_sp.AAC.1
MRQLGGRGRVAEAAYLAGSVSGGYPTQSILFMDRRTACPKCKLCCDIGAPQHSIVGCPAAWWTRRELD